jgi:hypothetical protein
LVIVVIAVVWIITPPGIYEKSAAETLTPLAETLVPLAETTVHSGKAAVKSTKSTAVEATAAAETSTSAPAMRSNIGEIWLAERGGAQQSSCDCQCPSALRLGFRFV